MINWLNHQNKRHFALFAKDSKLEAFDNQITWTDLVMLKRSESLNKRLARMSPRRGKKVNQSLVMSLVEANKISSEFLKDISEILEYDEDTDDFA